MNAILISAGAACLIAAVVGGGLKAFGVEIPQLASVRRQVLLALLGTAFLTFAYVMGGGNPPSLGGMLAGKPTPKDDAGPDALDSATAVKNLLAPSSCSYFFIPHVNRNTFGSFAVFKPVGLIVTAGDESINTSDVSRLDYGLVMVLKDYDSGEQRLALQIDAKFPNLKTHYWSGNFVADERRFLELNVEGDGLYHNDQTTVQDADVIEAKEMNENAVKRFVDRYDVRLPSCTALRSGAYWGLRSTGLPY